MSNDRLASYRVFCRDCRGSFRRIARKAGDCDADDVASEAWLMAVDFDARGQAVDFEDAAFRDRLLAHLYQHFVRYNDRKIAAAQRFERDDDALPLLERLAAPTLDPLASAMLDEDPGEIPMPSYRHSQAAAWARFISLRDGHMPTVARHLMISLSWCYRRYGRVLRLAESNGRWRTPCPYRRVSSQGHGGAAGPCVRRTSTVSISIRSWRSTRPPGMKRGLPN